MAAILICAGSDSGGGAGIQADLKTVMALGGYAMTAITALTAQNTLGVYGVVPVDPDFIRLQMRLVLSDLGADAIKTGMLGDADAIAAIAETLAELVPDVPLVVDPVMIAKGGAALLAAEAVGALKTLLIPRATLLTPNLPEAEVAARPDRSPRSRRDARRAGGRGLCAASAPGRCWSRAAICPAIGSTMCWSDRMASRSSKARGLRQGIPTAPAAPSPRPSRTRLGQGMTPRYPRPWARARAYLIEAIRTAPGFGQGPWAAQSRPHGKFSSAVSRRP